MTCRVLAIGVGNELRRDDGAGLETVRRLRGQAGLEVREVRGDLSVLAGEWERADRVFLVDAVRSGSAPGTLHRFDAGASPLPAVFARGSTHAIGIAGAVELARALGRLPAALVVFGIEGRDFGHGEGLTPEVERGVAAAVLRIAEETRGA
ncbi:MAG: hydrogenase maturation protease [Candidatus Brocadiae bacterium]|nr:hydrogenase maturation protease [Candidatus Brocadiia bacterium]